MSVYVIAEAGVNHNGSFELAKKLVLAAKEAGADCIKFQTFVTENLVIKEAKKADYQVQNTGEGGSQFDMLKALELSFDEFVNLKAFCEEVGIEFLSTPFDFDSIEFLAGLGMKFWKIPSGEITNLPYLEAIARTGKPVVLSTGMCDMEDVRAAVKILRDNGCMGLSILHCTTEYPAPIEECNFNVLATLADEFGVPVGYSDHTKGILAPIIAVAKGAKIIEKHFTLDKNMEGPDHKASLNPAELKEMVDSIRLVEASMGNGKKEPVASEIGNKAVARKSIVAAVDIKAGEIFTKDNLTVKRPGSGISPMRWYEVIGQAAGRDFGKDELIEL